MNITVKNLNLIQGLQKIVGVVDKKALQPVLSNVLIRVVDQVIYLVGGDLETEVKTKLMPMAVLEEGSVTTSAKKLLDICRSLQSEEEVNMQTNGGKLLVKSKYAKFNLSTLPVSDFVELNAKESVKILSLDAKKLSKSLQKIVFASAFQDVRYYLNGVLFDINEDKLVLVATDGHRMNYYEQNISNSVKISAIVPKKSVQELIRLLHDESGEVNVYKDDRFLVFIFNGVKMVTKLIDGVYPNYIKALPAPGNIFAHIDVNTLKSALQRAAILASEKNKGVNLELKQNRLYIFSRNAEQESSNDEIAINYSGPDITIGFNSTYLLELLNHLSSDDFYLYASSPTSSVLIKENVQDSPFKFVVMPMRI